jgi:hypothetical protein
MRCAKSGDAKKAMPSIAAYTTKPKILIVKNTPSITPVLIKAGPFSGVLGVLEAISARHDAIKAAIPPPRKKPKGRGRIGSALSACADAKPGTPTKHMV